MRMTRAIDGFCRMLEILIAAFLAVMVVMVFGNVVLRYAFNSGIIVSEEVSRWLFLWVTFLGAIVALKEHGHIGTAALIWPLPVLGKKICLVLGYLLMLYATWLVFSGALAQVRINLHVEVDAHLCQGTGEHQPGGVEHQQIAEHEADFLAEDRQARYQRVGAQVAVLLERDDRAEKGHPEKQPARHFFRNDDAGVEGVAQDHVAEHHDHHHRQKGSDQDLEP